VTGRDYLRAVCGVVEAACRGVWRACGSVRTVMCGHCAVVAAVRDVLRVCRACVFVCYVSLAEFTRCLVLPACLHSHTVLCVSDSMQCADWR
jgi:hypothetical protein